MSTTITTTDNQNIYKIWMTTQEPGEGTAWVTLRKYFSSSLFLKKPHNLISNYTRLFTHLTELCCCFCFEMLRGHAHTTPPPPLIPSLLDPPAFRSFLLRYTEKMTRRLPRMSTTMVKMRKQPKVVVTHGGRFRTASLGSAEELFRWDPFITIVQLFTQLGPNSNRAATPRDSSPPLGGEVLKPPAAFLFIFSTRASPPPPPPSFSPSSSFYTPPPPPSSSPPRVDCARLPWTRCGSLPLALLASVSLLRARAIHFVGSRVWHEAANFKRSQRVTAQPRRDALFMSLGRGGMMPPGGRETQLQRAGAREASYFFGLFIYLFIYRMRVHSWLCGRSALPYLWSPFIWRNHSWFDVICFWETKTTQTTFTRHWDI